MTLTHGQVCYLELPAADRHRAAAFYRAVFGWEVIAPPAPDGPDRVLATIGDPEGNPVGLAAHG